MSRGVLYSLPRKEKGVCFYCGSAVVSWGSTVGAEVTLSRMPSSGGLADTVLFFTSGSGMAESRRLSWPEGRGRTDVVLVAGGAGGPPGPPPPPAESAPALAAPRVLAAPREADALADSVADALADSDALAEFLVVILLARPSVPWLPRLPARTALLGVGDLTVLLAVAMGGTASSSDVVFSPASAGPRWPSTASGPPGPTATSSWAPCKPGPMRRARASVASAGGWDSGSLASAGAGLDSDSDSAPSRRRFLPLASASGGGSRRRAHVAHARFSARSVAVAGKEHVFSSTSSRYSCSW